MIATPLFPSVGQDRRRTVTIAAYQPDIAPNLGALIRLSVCMGVRLHVIEPCGFPFAPKAWARTAMDYADLADLVRHDGWEPFRAAVPGRIVALSAQAGTALWDHSFAPGDTVLLGRETAGLPEAVLADCDAALRIPIDPRARSLNIVAAAAIALGEAQRQAVRG